MRQWRFEEKPACSVKNEPFPEEVKCTNCGAWVEVWSDEEEACCHRCGMEIRVKKGLIE